MKTTYYTHVSVRDQVVPAEKKSKCRLEFKIPPNIPALRINKSTWITVCTDRCTTGCCEVIIRVHPLNDLTPISMNLYYFTNRAAAYVTFFPEAKILRLLKQKGILDPDALRVAKNASEEFPPSMTAEGAHKK